MQTTDILILGGGLCGVHTASELARRGASYLLVEARQRLGGRILSHRAPSMVEASEAPAYDLGPAWFWPGQQRMASLIRRLGLASSVVDQFGTGDTLYEDPSGQLHRGRFGASMTGSYRLRGGIGEIIEALAARVPNQRVRLGWRAISVTWSENELVTRLSTEKGQETIRSQRVVVAMPPRLAESTIQLSPQATPAFRRALLDTPTWMAAQAKLVALYEQAFWRQSGLSGDVISHRGPLGEIHDISPSADGPGALFGFFAIPPASRASGGEALQRDCMAQLAKLFGESASRPETVFLKDWAFDPLTATAMDREKIDGHSETTLTLPQDDPWHDYILWSGSETASAAQRHNGYLEGALEASERTLEKLEKRGRGE